MFFRSRPFFPDFRVLSDLTVGILGAGNLGSSSKEFFLFLVTSLLKPFKTNLFAFCAPFYMDMFVIALFNYISTTIKSTYICI